MQIVQNAAAAARQLAGCRVIDAEFMYRQRPAPGPERVVFDGALRSRLRELGPDDGVLWIANSAETLDSLNPFVTEFSHLRQTAALVNPAFESGDSGHTPRELRWQEPDSWARCTMTDRWARIDFALATGSALGEGWLAMPAHDAVWGRGLLTHLMRFALRHAQGSVPAAVSPYAPQPHSSMTGVDIPRDVIDLLNAAFERDSLLAWRIRRDQMQGFWGKMALMPCVQCDALLQHVNRGTFEDDLHIDRVLREQGFRARAWWAGNRSLYRQVLPVFDRAGARAVIERTLHYSLNVSGVGVGGSLLNMQRDPFLQMKARFFPHFGRACREADNLIAECSAEISFRLTEYGASWVDWGAFRHVVRVGDPYVEVWRRLKA